MNDTRFVVNFSPDKDNAGALAEALAIFGSLKANREKWAELLGVLTGTMSGPDQRAVNARSIGSGIHGWACTIAQEIVESAVPEEGNPHPQRAQVTVEQDGADQDPPSFLEVMFKTPGGVTVAIEETRCSINFHRESNHAALRVATAFAGYGIQVNLWGHAPEVPWVDFN